MREHPPCVHASQVDEAFEYLTRMQEADQPDVRYEVSVTRGDTQARGRGVYLREPADSARPVRFTAKVEATFHEVRCRPSQSLPAYNPTHAVMTSCLLAMLGSG